MRAVVVKIPEDLIKDGQECASALQLTRSAYICRAIEHFNRETKSIIRAKKLAAASRNVRSERCVSTLSSRRSNKIQMPDRAIWPAKSNPKRTSASQFFWIPNSSKIFRNWLDSTFSNCCCFPLGHSTSSRSTMRSLPSPKVSGNSLWEQ